MTSQSRPGSSRPSLTLPPGLSPLSITGYNPLLGLDQFHKPQATPSSTLSPKRPKSGQSTSPRKLGPGSTPPLHPTSPARVPPGLTLPASPSIVPAGGWTSPVQQTSSGKGGLRWGSRWGKSRSPGHGSGPPSVQPTDPSRSCSTGWGSPLVHSSSPSRNWEGSGGTPVAQSSSPSQHWIAAGSDSGVPSSSPSRVWGGAATPPVQSSAPSFLKGWLQKQRGHSVVEEQAMEAFRLQLALEAGQLGPSSPCILDQQLHAKPHHQPILFVDDSLAPNLQLPSKPRRHPQAPQMIAAAHAATAPAAGGSCYPYSDDSDQGKPPYPSHGSQGVASPQERADSICDGAESISSSPDATPMRFMKQLMSHGKGMTHASEHAAPAQEADMASKRSTTAGRSGLLRQASRDHSASSSQHMRVAGPSHGADSRFAAMKSLTRSAMSPRHAVSLDSPATLAATRRRGTLAHNHHPSHDPATHAQAPVGGSFDFGTHSLSPASSFGGSAGGSFTEGRPGSPRASLSHLVSAPVAGGFADALAAAAPLEDSELLSLRSIASPTAPLLAVGDSSSAEHHGGAAAGTPVCDTDSHDLSFGLTASHSMTDSSGSQAAGRARQPCHPQGHSSANPPGSANHQHGETGSVMVNLPVALSVGASKQLQQVPLSQDSLDFSLDSVYTPGLATEASDSQQLLHSAGPTSSSLVPDEQPELQHNGSSSASVLEDEQTMSQNVLVPPTVTDRPQQQLDRSSASPDSSHRLDRHDHESLLEQQDRQLSQDLMPAVSSVSHRTPDPLAEQPDQPLLGPLDDTSAALPEDQQQPLLSMSEPMHLRDNVLMAMSKGEGTAAPLLPVAKGNSDATPPPVLPVAIGNANGTAPLLLLNTVGNPDGTAPPLLPVALGSADAHNGGGCPGERQQGVARVLSKLPSLQSMTQRLRSHSQRVLQPMTQQHLGRPATVDEAEEVQKSHASMQHDTDAHVVVFVHGFRGSARDLGAVRSHMQLAQPELDFLMSKSNQDKTADGLQVMGHRLAQEVVHYLQVGGGPLPSGTA
ncbi:hypothetical protein ABBQ38_004872 [Trebouxia sp. C0009 RCD-2024]